MVNASPAAEWLPLDPANPAMAATAAGIQDQPRGLALEALLQTGWLQLLLCVAAALPLFWPHLPPLTDLGGHLGRYAVQLDGSATASLRRWYSFRWGVIPNLGTDLLMQVLAPHMGLEPALKAIVVATVVLQISGFLVLAKTVHGRIPVTALLALPLVYGYPFLYGFLNFTLCTALATWALALWIALDKPGLALTRWLVFVPVAGALWVCHLSGWALFCILAAGIELGRARDQALSWRDAVIRSAVPLSCLLVPCLMFALWPHADGSPRVTEGWFDLTAKLGMIVMVLRDRWELWDTASALLLIGMIGWTWRSRRFARHSGLVLGALLASAAFLLVPRHVGGTSFVDMRLVPMILAIALIAVRPRDHCPRRIVEMLALAGLVFTGARFAGNAASLALYDRQITQDLTVLDAMPRDTLLVSLTLKPCLKYDPWPRERRTHLAGYALARRHDFSNDQWFVPGGQLLRVHNEAVGPFRGDPSQTACRGIPAVADAVASVPVAVRYLWIIENGVARLFPGWHPIRLSAGSVLYTRDDDGIASTRPALCCHLAYCHQPLPAFWHDLLVPRFGIRPRQHGHGARPLAC